MRVIPGILLSTLLTACTQPQRTAIHEFIEEPKRIIRVENNNPTYKAIQYINYNERTHRSELRELIGVDPRRTEWCAAFVNAVLEESGIESNKDHAYPLTARAYLDWGIKVNKQDIQPGDVVVFPRGNQGWQGHVGFFVKKEVINGVEYWLILGGNQNNKVSIVPYRANRSLGVRRQGQSI